MRIIRRTFSNLSKSTLLLGKEGEHLVTKLELDISKELREFHDPSFELVLKMPAFDEPYPVLVQVIDGKLLYTFSDDDLATRGFGELEALVCGPNGEVLKSTTAKTRIDSSIIKNTYPGPLQKIIDEIYEIIDKEVAKHGIPVANVLPETADVNTVLYLAGTGFYRFTTEWTRITRDDLESTVGGLSLLIPSAEKQLAWDGAVTNEHTHSNKSVLDGITPNDVSLWDSAASVSHSHSNKSTLDGITSEKVTAWDGAVSKEHTHSNKSTLDGITLEKAAAWDGAVSKEHTHSNGATLNGISASDVSAWNSAVADKHTHSNKSVLDLLSEENDELRFADGKIGGLLVIDTADGLSEIADQDDSELVLFDQKEEHIVYPPQSSDEEVSVDVAGKNIRICSPKFNETAIDAAIAAADISASGTLHLELPDNEDGDIIFGILPVVSDIDTNEYTAAGITLDDAIVTESYTKKYAVSALINPSTHSHLIPSDKIVDVDAEHVKIPFLWVYTFEDVTNEDNYAFVTGWNMFLATVDKETYSDISATEFVGSVNINDYLIFSADYDNTLTLEGVSASDLFKGVVDVVGQERKKGLYVNRGSWQRFDDVQSFIPLEFKEYKDLLIRDLFTEDGGIQDVPVYNVGETGSICRILDSSENSVSLEETRQASGDPVRFIKVYIDGTYYVWLPVELVTQISTTPAGWSSGGQTVDAPSLAGFSPVKIEVDSTTYTNLSSLPKEAELALGSLSQCINEFTDAMGYINIPDDAVVRYAGKIEPNRKYYFKTGSDVFFDLPDVSVSKEDAQFVIYLNCRASDVDISFPSDTMFCNEIDSSEGLHKIIGFWLKDKKCWAVGCVTYEEASA